jgi:hypothetical protein
MFLHDELEGKEQLINILVGIDSEGLEDCFEKPNLLDGSGQGMSLD